MSETNSEAEGDEFVLPRECEAGVCLHITSLPGSFGIGEIGDAARNFIDLLARMNLRVWQFLPIGPTGYGDSPYQPLSTFACNEMLIDTATLIRAGLVTSNEADGLIHLPKEAVDFGSLIEKKKELLNRAAGRFHAQANAEILAGFDDFLEQNDKTWLQDYALFRVLKSGQNERAWTEWEPEYAHRDAKSLAAVEARAFKAIENIKIIQFLFHRQWRRLREYAAEQGIRMFGDLPIYIALDSSDAWANRDLLCLDSDGRPTQLAGVPPDYFCEDGQLWGNPVYDWDVHSADGFSWWIERMRRSAELADIVRIDHFRGFEAFWSVPADAETARTGEWRSGHGAAIFDAMRRDLGHLPIVAEDLGIITPEVERLRESLGIPGMKVLQFEVSREDFCIDEIAANCVCYTGTHDNDTTIGWFNNWANSGYHPDEIDRVRELVLAATAGTPETINTDLIRLAFSSKARLAMAPLQDYLGLGSEARLNKPGTLDNNWRWRMNPDQLTPAIIESVADMVDESGRSRAAFVSQ